MVVKCEAKTCEHYCKGKCTAEEIEITNFTWWSEEEHEELDEMKCDTYKYFINWMYREDYMKKIKE